MTSEDLKKCVVLKTVSVLKEDRGKVMIKEGGDCAQWPAMM
jgi:hypothetical protein